MLDTIARLIPCISAAALLVGCSQQAVLPDAPVPTDVKTQEYVISPGDILEVFVWRSPEFSATVPVRPDGKITTPLVEDMPAVGKAPSQLARDMEAILSEYLRSPTVTIIVKSFADTVGGKVRVVGAAAKPRALEYAPNMTVLDVMIAVGGLSEYAAGNRAKISRRSENGMQEISVRLDDLLNKGDLSANVRVHPGDILVIPQSRF